MSQDNFNIECLKNDIERKVGRAIKSPIDFDFLSNKIKQELNETLSASTLQRLWNYVATTSKPRTSTLSLLARFLGFSCWDSYVQNLLRTNAIESDYITTRLIRSHDLCPGDCLRIGWRPDRECEIRYLGDFKYVVTSSKNSKLHAKDSFMAMSFSLGNPLIITNLVQNGTEPSEYTAGKKNGLTILEILPPLKAKPKKKD